MPLNGRPVRLEPVPVDQTRANWVENLGEGPYYWVQRAYTNTEWESYMTVGIGMIAELYRQSGAILTKLGHEARTQQ